MCMMSFAVTSRVRQSPLTVITVDAPGPRICKRRALGIARTKGIPKPVAIDQHQAAVAIRRQAAAMRKPMPNLNSGTPFWRQHDNLPVYSGR